MYGIRDRLYYWWLSALVVCAGSMSYAQSYCHSVEALKEAVPVGSEFEREELLKVYEKCDLEFTAENYEVLDHISDRLYFLDDPEMSIKILYKLEPNLHGSANSEKRAINYKNIGFLEYALGHLDMALEYLRRGLDLSDSIGLMTNYTKCANVLGVVYDDVGDHETSAQYYLKGLRAMDKEENRITYTMLQMNLANATHYSGNTEQADKVLREILNDSLKYNSMEDRARYADCYLNLAVYTPDANLSIHYCTKALSLWQGNSSPLSREARTTLYYNRSRKFENQKKYELAFADVKTGLSISEGAESSIMAKHLILRKAWYAMRDSNTVRALELVDSIVEITKSFDILDLKIDTYEMKSMVLEAAGRTEEALEAFMTYSALDDSLLSLETRKQLQNDKIKYDLALKNEELDRNKELIEKEESEIARVEDLQLLSLGTILFVVLGLIVVTLLVWRARAVRRQLGQQVAERDRIEIEKRYNNLRVEALNLQMNPHLIFNCLQSIQSLILSENPERSHGYLDSFSLLLKHISLSGARDRVILHEEIEFARMYVELERLRFGNRFDLEIHISEEDRIKFSETYVTPMIIQPFLENSINHGFASKERSDYKIDMHLRFENEFLVCKIIDNGEGLDHKTHKPKKGNRLAIGNIDQRLNILKQGSVVSLERRTDTTGAIVTIRMPYWNNKQKQAS